MKSPDRFSPGPEPCMLRETAAYLLAYKPPGMHSAPLKGGGPSLADWCAALFPEIREIRGIKAGEGGLLHRLDFETHGLVIFARNQQSYDLLLRQQKEGLLIKEYGALAAKSRAGLRGFPPPPFTLLPSGGVVESVFRPYGPGRREVRPLAGTPGRGGSQKAARDQGGSYCTEILETLRTGGLPSGEEIVSFRIQIRRGFRHQIRCHLAWLGFPILNDPVYGGIKAPGGCMALRAQGVRFYDPRTGEETGFSLPRLE
jgi:23S rRNA pseudouridine1911/1915/1917 synthase